MEVGEASAEDIEDVSNGGASGSRNNPHTFGQEGQGAFARSIAETFGKELALEGFKALEKFARAVAPFDAFHIEVVTSVRCIDGDAACGANLITVIEGGDIALRLLSKGEKGGIELRSGVA